MVISHQLPPYKTLLPCMLAFFAGAAFAQVSTNSEPSKAALPTKLQYTSAIDAYQPYEDQPVQSWRKANDHVGQIGGWGAYAKEIKTGVPASAKDGAPTNDPHAGHHGGGKP